MKRDDYIMKKENSIDSFLKESYHVEINHPELIDLSNSIKKNISKNDRDIANGMFEWVRDNIKYDVIDIIGALGTYKRGIGACVDKSSLLIALLRINNIPSRYLLLRAFLITKTPISVKYVDHCALEAHINSEWIILDPTFDSAFDRFFPTASYNSPNWWDIETSIISANQVAFSKLEMKIISKSYKKPSDWKTLVSKILKSN